MIKDNLIQVGRVTNLFVFFLLALSSCKFQQNFSKKGTIMYNILFTSGFMEDSIDLEINGKPIFKSVLLNSDYSDGVTNCSVKISVGKDKYIVSTSKNSEVKFINKQQQKIMIKIFYKGNYFEFTPIQEKGKYILISSEKILVFTQSIKAPVFD